MRTAVLAIAVLGLCSACASSAAAPVARPARRFVLVVRLHPSSVFSRVESVDARGRVVRNLAGKVFDASVSPDGALVALDERTGLYVVRIDGSGRRLLLRGKATDYSYGFPDVWSPDSKQLLVSVPNWSRLAVVTVATGAERILPPPWKRRVYYMPSGWSGPANEIFFRADRGNSTHMLVVAHPSGASPRRIFWDTYSEDEEPMPSLSPDGKSAAYTSEEHSDEVWNLGTIDVASGKDKWLPNRDQIVQAPVWAPDSSRFAIGFKVLSNRGAFLYSLGIPSATALAWTSAGLYLATKPAGVAKLVFVSEGQNSTETLFSLPHGQAFTSVQPLG
jgi:hypothetical protein